MNSESKNFILAVPENRIRISLCGTLLSDFPDWWIDDDLKYCDASPSVNPVNLPTWNPAQRISEIYRKQIQMQTSLKDNG